MYVYKMKKKRKTFKRILLCILFLFLFLIILNVFCSFLKKQFKQQFLVKILISTSNSKWKMISDENLTMKIQQTIFLFSKHPPFYLYRADGKEGLGGCVDH